MTLIFVIVAAWIVLGILVAFGFGWWLKSYREVPQDDSLPPLRSQLTPLVPPSWRPADEALQDPSPHDPAP